MMLECNLPHRGSIAVLCMLEKIRSNIWHPLCGTLPDPSVPVRVTRCTLDAYWYSYAPPHCITLSVPQHFYTSIRHSVSLWNDLVGSMFDGVGLAGFKSGANDSF